jgi:hypothetical protein
LVALLLTVFAVPAGAAPPVQLWDEADLRLRTGVNATVLVRVSIAEGYRLVGAGVQHGSLRGLQLRMQPAAGVRFGAPSYPRPRPAQLVTDAAAIPAHEGVVAIRLPVQVVAGTKWRTATLRGALRYQACRAGRCDAPQALPVALEVELVGDSPAR